MSEAERRSQRWRLDKRLSVGELVTILIVVAGAVVWSWKQESRITVLEKVSEVQTAFTRQQFSDVKDTLRRIEETLEQRRQ